MSRLQLLVVLVCCLPLAACLRCYTCLFPALTPMDCLKFPQECPAGQRCLSSIATGRRGKIQHCASLCNGAVPVAALSWAGLVLCVLPALCLLLA